MESSMKGIQDPVKGYPHSRNESPFDNKKSGGALKPVDEVASEHLKFKKRLGRVLKSKREEVKIASSKDTLMQQIREIEEKESPHALAIKNLDQANEALDNYQREREHGSKRAGARAQNFFNGFAQFVDAYSGILKLVAKAGSPYGEVGYESLSILLIVIVSKSKNDDKIIKLLDDIRKSFPRMKNWVKIYATDEMGSLVEEAYNQVIEFARAAAEYFTRFWRRVLVAAIPIKSMRLDDLAASIHRTLAEINAEAMYRLHERTAEYHERNIEQMNIIKNLEASLKQQAEAAEDRQRQKDQKKLHEFENILNVKHHPDASDLSSCKVGLMETFPDYPQFSRLVPYTAYTQMNPPRLQGRNEFNQWIESNESCLLFLNGHTEFHGQHRKGFTYCWLSPAAVYIAEDLEWQGEKIAFFSCDPRLERFQVQEILWSIILQVLRWNPYILREKSHQYKDMVPGANDGTIITVEKLINLMSKILEDMKNIGRIFIVLDRLDRLIQPENHYDQPEERNIFKHVMNRLAGLVTSTSNTSPKIKIAVIAETSGGNGNWDETLLPELDFAQHRVFACRNWDQTILTTQETSQRDRPLIWSGERTIQI